MDQLIKDKHYTAWQLLKTYWQSNEKFSAYIFTVVILLMTIILVGFEVVFNYWYNYFYNALQEYNVRGAVRLIIIFFILAAFYIVLQVYRYYISQLFGLKWRRWLTKQLIARWLAKRGYYYLENFDEKTDNPDQRIQEDVNALVSNSIDLTVGLVSAITTFPAFVYILWTLSGVLIIPLGSLGNIHIHGYLVWAAVLYNLIGTLIAFKIGRPLIALNFEQQRREATFRFSAIDLRSHSENVALYRGEEHQKSILEKWFGRVLENWYFIILRQKKLLWFTGGFNQTAVMLPLVVALPNYFNRVFMLGGLIQSIRAFTSVQDSLAFLVNAYTQIAQWRAIMQRLTTFLNHLADVEERTQQRDHIKVSYQPANKMRVSNLSITTPQDKKLLNYINEEFVHGKHYLIKGDSGIGKSTFLRTLAGIWPFAEGEIVFPEKKHMMYVPQQTYMPIGSFAEAILFPDKEVHQDEAEELKEVMRACHLEHFIPKLHETATWSEQLSPGEQQRVAFARVLLHKPDWVFLDESTSMLDLANENYLYGLLKEKLPQCSIVSIGHRPSLIDFHDHVIDMAKYAQ